MFLVENQTWFLQNLRKGFKILSIQRKRTETRPNSHPPQKIESNNYFYTRKIMSESCGLLKKIAN